MTFSSLRPVLSAFMRIITLTVLLFLGPIELSKLIINLKNLICRPNCNGQPDQVSEFRFCFENANVFHVGLIRIIIMIIL